MFPVENHYKKQTFLVNICLLSNKTWISFTDMSKKTIGKQTSLVALQTRFTKSMILYLKKQLKNAFYQILLLCPF